LPAHLTGPLLDVSLADFPDELWNGVPEPI
jgi:hypothetical protein